MDFDDVKRSGAFRRIHDFGAPLASAPLPSGSGWIPSPGEEIFLSFEPKQTSFIQNTKNPPESLFGIHNFKYQQALEFSLEDTGSPYQSFIPSLPESYVEFELYFEETFGGSVLLSIQADAISGSCTMINQVKLQGRFRVTRVDLEMRVS